MWPNRGSRQPGSSTSPEQPDEQPKPGDTPGGDEPDLQSPPVPPAVSPRPPGEDEPEEKRDRRTVWLVVVTVIAVLAAGAAGYAISEIESTKDENREDDQAVSALQTDIEALEQELTGRLDRVEADVGQAATRAQAEKLQEDLAALEKRVSKLDQQDDGGESDAISSRVDDLEQRVEDLESEN